MNPAMLEKLLSRNADANKYDFGHVLVVGGSPGMVGAPFLAAMGALRVGAGLVTIASTSDVIDKLEKRVVEIMTLRIPNDVINAIDALVEFIEKRKVTVVVLGPGMDSGVAMIAKQLISHLKAPAVLDAGALTCFRDDLTLFDQAARRGLQLIGTPHDGEFEKLSGAKLPTELKARKKAASHFATTHQVTLLCKGYPTLVAHADGSVYENHTGNPGLATAGSGDVLTGVIAGLVAQGFDVSESVDRGAYLHGLAGDIAVKDKTQAGLIASDIVDYLPDAIKEAINAT